jgi:hypothetical protein
LNADGKQKPAWLTTRKAPWRTGCAVGEAETEASLLGSLGLCLLLISLMRWPISLELEIIFSLRLATCEVP